MSIKIRLLLLAILVPTLFACFYLVTQQRQILGENQDQVFDENNVLNKHTKVVEAPCDSDYAKAAMTRDGTSSIWSGYMEIMKPDGHTSICMYELGAKPMEWKFSPDGRYLYTFTLYNHNWGYEVYQLSTGKIVCDGRGDGSRWVWVSYCPPIRMADGRWWSGVFPDVVLKTNDPRLWNLVHSSQRADPVVSPDGEWIVGKGSDWFFASSDDKVIQSFSLPYSNKQAPACGMNPGRVAWRADSKEFAVLQDTDRVVFVWTIQEDGSIHQDDAMLAKCTLVLKYTSDGNITTK